MTTVVNVVKLFFQCNYATIGIISVKIIKKYAASNINNAEKSFIILTAADNVITFLAKLYKTSNIFPYDFDWGYTAIKIIALKKFL